MHDVKFDQMYCYKRFSCLHTQRIDVDQASDVYFIPIAKPD